MLFAGLGYLPRSHYETNCRVLLGERVEVKDQVAASTDGAVVQQCDIADGLEFGAPGLGDDSLLL